MMRMMRRVGVVALWIVVIGDDEDYSQIDIVEMFVELY